MNEHLKTGFVILNYRSWRLTKALTEKVSSFSCVDRVVVVDNASGDDSWQQFQEWKNPKITLLQSGKNGGYSFGNNRGVEKCRELGMDVVFVANPDVDIEEDSLRKLIVAFEETGYSLLSCLEYDGTGNLSKDPVWHIHSYWEDILDCFFLGRSLLRKKPPEKLDTAKKVQPVELVKGSFFGICIGDFTEIGGLDENVFLFCEERILGRRLRNAGKTLGLVTDASYQHNHSASIKNVYRSRAKQIAMQYQSRRYFHRVYNQIPLWKRIFLRLAMEISLLEYRCVDAVAFVKYKVVNGK